MPYVQGADGHTHFMPEAEWLAARNEAQARTAVAQAMADAAHARVAMLQARLSHIHDKVVISNPVNPQHISEDISDDPTCE